MSSNCLRTPNGFCQRGIPLEHLFFPLSFIYFFSPLIWGFYTCSGGDAEYESITASTQQLVWKWAILFRRENNATFSRKGRTKKNVDCFRKKKKKEDKNRRRKTVLLNALSYPRRSRQRQDCADKSSAGGMFIMCR